MKRFKDSDWKEYTSSKITTNVLESVLDGQSPSLHFGWISLLYKKYRLGDWNCKIPSPKSLDDKTYLMWDNECYCMFHSIHEKFGKNIIECAHPYAKNVFVFFDYSTLSAAFEALDNGNQLPYIPTYYAQPEDRHDFKNSEHEWE